MNRRTLRRKRPRVWLGTSGEYSSYQVERVFASQKAAEAWASCEYGRHAGESFEVIGDLDLSGAIPYITHHYRLSRSSDNAPTERHDRGEYCWYPWHASLSDEDDGIDYSEPPKQIHHRVHISAHHTARYDWAEIDLWVEGSDIKRADKVFSEQRAQIVANFDILVAAHIAEHGINDLTDRSGWRKP